MSQIRKLILSVITLIVVLFLGGSLFASFSEPQITDRLELYQTDLLLRASELKPTPSDPPNLATVRNTLLGENPAKTALEQYQSVRSSATENLEELQTRLTAAQDQLPRSPEPNNPETRTTPAPTEPATLEEQDKQLRLAVEQQQSLIDQLDLRIGLLQAEQNKTDAAIDTWRTLKDRLASFQPTAQRPSGKVSDRNSTASIRAITPVLIGLWSEPPRLLPNAESQIQTSLDGWFRDRSLRRLYALQQRQDSLTALEANQQQVARSTLVKLALVGVAPAIGSFVGVVLLLVVVGRWLTRAKQPPEKENLAWQVPWTGETAWQVLVGGFFFLGQLVVPAALHFLPINFSAFGTRAQAVNTLCYYLLMAGATLLTLYFSIRSYLPLPKDWFQLTGRRNWFLWGVGGYLVALPLMLAVSLVNQQLWQGQGGSNPLLQIVLEEGDPIALGIFLFTAAVAAPVFEELLFRGFLLPSLTRYFPVWGAIALSSLLFAIAHLSLSEVLPLAVLGSILGFVYTRSRGLLTPMLMHSLWNSITMLGLFILGRG
ncbi:CPBP family intramembrane glutamic endopeptidase [Leptolyngbya ohadii]|uniref:CPBP family intramembrane glutamic endopeptidase n=1 Tax=Leptolyngbya ohadii TaxID=1962290 RepID=UPI000B59F8FB|nr:CPBP family glutamic-type intramembrane protease [Leptolyngbya ohadii]